MYCSWFDRESSTAVLKCVLKKIYLFRPVRYLSSSQSPIQTAFNRAMAQTTRFGPKVLLDSTNTKFHLVIVEVSKYPLFCLKMPVSFQPSQYSTSKYYRQKTDSTLNGTIIFLLKKSKQGSSVVTPFPFQSAV